MTVPNDTADTSALQLPQLMLVLQTDRTNRFTALKLELWRSRLIALKVMNLKVWAKCKLYRFWCAESVLARH